MMRVAQFRVINAEHSKQNITGNLHPCCMSNLLLRFMRVYCFLKSSECGLISMYCHCKFCWIKCRGQMQYCHTPPGGNQDLTIPSLNESAKWSYDCHKTLSHADGNTFKKSVRYFLHIYCGLKGINSWALRYLVTEMLDLFLLSSESHSKISTFLIF